MLRQVRAWCAPVLVSAVFCMFFSHVRAKGSRVDTSDSAWYGVRAMLVQVRAWCAPGARLGHENRAAYHGE
jgi:hypothetical protein